MPFMDNPNKTYDIHNNLLMWVVAEVSYNDEFEQEIHFWVLMSLNKKFM